MLNNLGMGRKYMSMFILFMIMIIALFIGGYTGIVDNYLANPLVQEGFAGAATKRVKQ